MAGALRLVVVYQTSELTNGNLIEPLPSSPPFARHSPTSPPSPSPQSQQSAPSPSAAASSSLWRHTSASSPPKPSSASPRLALASFLARVEPIVSRT